SWRALPSGLLSFCSAAHSASLPDQRWRSCSTSTILAASISLTMAFLSPAESWLASAFSSTGAKRLVIWLSSGWVAGAAETVPAMASTMGSRKVFFISSFVSRECCSEYRRILIDRRRDGEDGLRMRQVEAELIAGRGAHVQLQIIAAQGQRG